MLASVWLLPKASRGTKVMATVVLSSPLSVCQKQMIQGSVATPPYEAQEPFAPREHNTVIDNVAETLALAIHVSVNEEEASKLRPRMVGTAPGVGESHFVFPSDCFEWSRRDNAFDARDEVGVDDRERVCAELASEWKRSEVDWGAREKPNVARCVPGCPVRASILGMTPEPALRSTCEGMVAARQDVRGLSFEFVDAHGRALDRLGRHAKPPRRVAIWGFAPRTVAIRRRRNMSPLSKRRSTR